MIETGENLKSTRISSGVTLEEASKDLGIPVIELEQLESGAIGAFDDIYKLKEKLVDYSKYLGLNTSDVIRNFNEYMFDYTSKLPMDEIQKEMKENEYENEKEEETRIASPYTRFYPKEKTIPYILVGLLVIVLVILTIFWSVKQITVGTEKTNIISYYEGD